MPSPEAIEVVLAFRRRLLALDTRTLKTLIDAYGPIWGELEAKIEALVAHSQLRGLMAQDIFRDQRFRSLQRQIERQVGEYAAQADATITAAQRGAVDLALSGSQQSVVAALPEGIDLELLARVGLGWNRLPNTAFEQFIGFASDGGPLARLLESLGAEAAMGVKDAIAQGIALGLSPIETAKLVRNRFGMPLTRSLTISRTETLRAYREATRAQYQANSDVVKGYRRSAAKDDRTCLACIALDGTRQETDEVMPIHPNCLLGDALVSGPQILAGMERFYIGDVFELVTRGGNRLSVTPNHPILTPGGWVPANFLTEGDYVVCDDGQEGVQPREYRKNQYAPTMIKEIVHSLRQSSGMAPRKMPTSTEDFHGDGMESYVDIVWANSLLRNNLRPVAYEPFKHQAFCGRHIGWRLLQSKSLLAQAFHAPMRSPNRYMGCSGIRAALLRGALRCHEPVGIGRSSDRNISRLQSAQNSGPANPILFTKTLLGDSTQIAIDELVHIGRHPFSGHVYNLQTTLGWYSANNIITHNCRCAAVPETLTYRELGLDVPEDRREVENARQWFEAQPETTQRDMMGEKRFNAWQDGKFQLEDMAQVVDDDTWGPGVKVKPLQELMAQ